ncbi:MAG: hypothetical protein M0R33_01410 [Methylomonas sp.]|jgi:hypothetical protein|uniref:hypothetical protein n=1 Tax=Methylomonas sp. TaxID=418 RepID=UPI0025F31AB5|nr:hypothetical protein [Methylomonas sp.]MCK9605090.1 hypothetical protein [Methylomonas sp.]
MSYRIFSDRFKTEKCVFKPVSPIFIVWQNIPPNNPPATYPIADRCRRNSDWSISTNPIDRSLQPDNAQNDLRATIRLPELATTRLD